MFKSAVLALALFILQTPAGGRLVLQGRIVKLGTTDAVAHARIVVAKVGGQISDYRTGTADDNGRFAFRDLSAGTYRVYADREGYLQTEYGRLQTSASGTPLVLTENQSTPEIVLSMTQPGVITGHVRENGTPIRNVWVKALKATYRDGQKSLNMVDYAQTNDLGEYRIFGLAPGRYFVSATPLQKPRIEDDTYVVPAIPSNANNNSSAIRTPGSVVLSAGTVDVAAFDGSVYLPVFYPGTTSVDAASAVEVKPGATVSGIDLTIVRSHQFHVRGRVINSVTGQLAQNISVVLSGGPASVPGSENSVFDLGGVPPGEYRLIAQVTTASNRMYSVTPVTVEDRDVDNIVVNLVPGVQIKGRLAIEGRPDNDPEVGQYLFQLQGTTGLPGYSAMNVRNDGSFTIDNVSFRDYRFRILRTGPGASGTPYVVAARFGSDDVLSAPIRVSSETADRLLSITVSLNTSTLDVQVTDRSQRAAPGILLAIVPDPARRNRSEFYRTATADATGHVHLEGLIPGDYKLFASTEIEAAAWQDPDVIQAYESQGTPIRLVGGSRSEVALRALQ